MKHHTDKPRYNEVACDTRIAVISDIRYKHVCYTVIAVRQFFYFLRYIEVQLHNHHMQ